MAKRAESVAPDRFIPTTFEELSPEFLSASLVEAGVLTTGRVRERRIEIIGEGIGFAGRVARIHLDYVDANDEGPTTLIAKLPSRVKKNRATVEIVNGYEREVCFFRELAGRSELPVPGCYYAEMDEDPFYEQRPTVQRCIEHLPVAVLRMLLPVSLFFVRFSKRRYLVLMEDLAPAENGDQIAGCDLAQAQQAVRNLATFHASYWADDSLCEKIWLPSIDTMPRGVMAVHRRSRRSFFREHGDAIPPEMKEACRWMDGHFESVVRHLTSPPWTVLHGDYRLDNLLFDGASMWATDFQIVARGRPGFDLAYFICGSVDPSVDERLIVDAYCDELRRQGVADYSRAECERDCALSKLWQIYLHVATDDLLDLGEERGARLIEVGRERLFSRIPIPPYDSLL